MAEISRTTCDGRVGDRIGIGCAMEPARRTERARVSERRRWVAGRFLGVEAGRLRGERDAKIFQEAKLKGEA